MLFTERGMNEGVEGQTKNYGSLVNIERFFGKGERFQFSFGIDNLAAVESGGEFRFEIGGNQILLRFLTGVDVESRANFHDHGVLKRAAAPCRIERSVNFRLHHVAPGRDLRNRREDKSEARH